IVPFQPDDSELWFILDFDEMPPADSEIAPLTAEEKAAVRRWIELGAVAVPWSPPPQTPSASATSDAPPAPPVSQPDAGPVIASPSEASPEPTQGTEVEERSIAVARLARW